MAKATGEIVEISEDCSYVYAEHFDKSYNICELEFLDVKEKSFPEDEDYWARLEHQAAIAAMQGMLSNPAFPKYSQEGYYKKNVVNNAYEYAHTLVEKYKEREANNG